MSSTDHRAQQTSRRSVERTRDAGESRATILVALGANALIAVVKLAGGLISGSTALLAEAAHSLADTANQGFLLASLRLGDREPTEERPFGHGEQRFLWTFIAAVGMFVAGAVFAVGYGIAELLRGGGSSEGFLVAWVTLAIAGAAEGVSWLKALRQTRGEALASGRSLWRFMRETRDPSAKMVLFEDSAALVGTAIAAAGVGLHEITGKALWDAGAAIVIGVVLIGVAVWMARDVAGLLVGAAALPEERAAIERVIEAHDDVVCVSELLTMVLGPKALLVAVRVNLRDEIDAGRIEHTSTALAHAVRDAVPDVTEFFLDATPGRSG